MSDRISSACIGADGHFCLEARSRRGVHRTATPEVLQNFLVMHEDIEVPITNRAGGVTRFREIANCT